MFLSSNEQYNSLLELMHYFYFEFNIYIILLIIIAINCFKSIIGYKQFMNNNENESFHYSDIIISIFCELAFFNALMLQGVVADISRQVSEQWFNKVFAVSIISFLLFIIQIYFICRLSKDKK